MPVLNALWSILKGIWFALDGLRKVLHLILLLVLFGLLIAASQTELPYVPDRAALVLTPEGYLVEELSGDPLDARAVAGKRRTARRRRACAISSTWSTRRATTTASRRWYSTSQGLEGAGLPMLQDLAQSIRWFRESGKKVYAYGEAYSAAPVFPRRRRRTRSTSTRWAMSCSRASATSAPISAARSTSSPWTSTCSRPAATSPRRTNGPAPTCRRRTARTPRIWVGALWDAYKTDVGAARKLEPGLIQAYADEAAAGVRATGGDLAQYALARGLVDALKTRHEFEAIVAEVVGEDEENGFTAVDWQGYLPYVRSEHGMREFDDQAVGVIVASGEILDGEQRRAWSAAIRLPRCCATRARTTILRPSCCASTARAAASWRPR